MNLKIALLLFISRLVIPGIVCGQKAPPLPEGTCLRNGKVMISEKYHATDYNGKRIVLIVKDDSLFGAFKAVCNSPVHRHIMMLYRNGKGQRYINMVPHGCGTCFIAALALSSPRSIRGPCRFKLIGPILEKPDGQWKRVTAGRP